MEETDDVRSSEWLFLSWKANAWVW
jgi:hypothetical protein